MTHLKYRADIDGLRAIAVLIVVGFHAFPEWLPGGYIGVDVFFVISGFLISTILFESLSKNSLSLSDFYTRRIKRIFPALLLILVTLLVLGWFFFIPEDYEKLGKHVFAGAAFVSNVVSLSEFGYFDEAAEFKPLLHLWSLGIEEQFYIVWPIVLWCAWRLKVSIGLLLLVLIICSFALNIYRSGYDSTFAFFALQTRAWELLLGACLAYFSLGNSPLMQRFKKIDHSWLTLLGMGLLVLGCFVLNRQSQFPGWWALLPTFGACLMITGGPHSWINRTVLAAKPLVAIGLISYPLYLWHWTLLAFFNVALGHIPSLSIRISLVLASLALAWLTYRLVETPIRHSKHGGRIAKILFGLMICVALFGLYIFKSSGFLAQTTQPKLKANMALEDCSADFKAGKLCVFGNKSATKTLLLYGDSHAEHLTTALNQTFGKNYKIIFAYHPGCFLGQEYLHTQQVPQACINQITQIKALSDQNIQAVIHAQRWHGYGLTEKEQIVKAVSDSIRVFNLNPEKIVLIGSTADVDLRCEKWNYYFGPSRWFKKCNDLKVSKAINERFIAITKDIQKPENVSFVYPYQKLCSNQKCHALENGTLYYSDSHHLTMEGALLIMPELKRIIDPPASK
jgi:peptidoglycan/LPS O-acetylase OafA/YrhL